MLRHLQRGTVSRLAFLRAAAGMMVTTVVAACSTASPAAPTAGSSAAPAAATTPSPVSSAPSAASTSAPATTTTGAGAAAPASAAAPAPTSAATSSSGAAQPAVAKVRAGLSSPVLVLDPAGNQLVGSYQTTVLTSGQLYRFDLQKKPVPDLVQSADVSADSKTITMTLKPNLVYSDGTPVLAEDVVFALDRQRKGQGSTYFTPIDSAMAKDERTIVWTLKNPYPDFFTVLGLHYLLIHPKSKITADPDYFKHPVSAGPYLIPQFTSGAPTTSLVPNPKYVGGPMAIGAIDLTTVADLTSRVLQLTSGQLDWVFDLPASARSGFPAQVTATPHPLGGIYHVTFNLSKTGPLADAKVRQAMSLAIDRDQVNREAFFGISPPAQAILYSGVPEFEPVLPNGGKRDLDGAKKLLASTPYASGFSFQLQTWGGRPGWKEATLVIAENLKDLGITATVDPFEDAVIVAHATSGSFEAMWTGTVALPVLALRLMLVKGSWADAAHYQNPQVTALLDQAQVEPDLTKRKDLLVQAQKLALIDMPHIPISERSVLSGTRLKNEVLTAVNNAEYIHVKTAAEAG